MAFASDTAEIPGCNEYDDEKIFNGLNGSETHHSSYPS